MGKFDAVIFDMDGVIIDSEPVYDRLTLDFLAELGVQTNAEIFEPLRGKTFLAFWQGTKEMFNLPQPVEELASENDRKLNDYFAHSADVVPMDGVIDCIRLVKAQGCRLGLASSTHKDRIEIILKRFQLWDVFEFVISGNDVKKGKPNPEIFLSVAKHFGVEPKKCLVIEDTENGVKAAKSAGMACAGFKGVAHNRQDLTKADWLVTSFAQIQREILSAHSSKDAIAQKATQGIMGEIPPRKSGSE